MNKSTVWCIKSLRKPEIPMRSVCSNCSQTEEVSVQRKNGVGCVTSPIDQRANKPQTALSTRGLTSLGWGSNPRAFIQHDRQRVSKTGPGVSNPSVRTSRDEFQSISESIRDSPGCSSQHASIPRVISRARQSRPQRRSHISDFFKNLQNLLVIICTTRFNSQ